MKNKINCTLVPFFIFFITLFSMCYVNAQEITKKQIKEEQKIEKQKKISKLVESKEFVFLANRMYPQFQSQEIIFLANWMSTQSGGFFFLSAENNVEFHPDYIKSFLPFVGRGFSGIGYGGDEGMKFEGKPSVYSIEKTKKGYLVKAEVAGKNDTFFMMVTVFFEGKATLSINSNNRSSISYDGFIEEFKKNSKTEN